MTDWRGRIILQRLAEGCTFSEAAAAASLSREALWKRTQVSPEFSAAVDAAREQGMQERIYRLWLRHPFRGRRPPLGTGHGGSPAFTYGRR